MPSEARKTGKLATVYLDIYDGSHGAAVNQIRILDAYDWELTTDVNADDATIKGETSMRYKIGAVTHTWRAQRYVQAPAVFDREVLNYINNPTPANLAAMGTTAAVDSGAAGTTGGLFGGGQVATVPFSGIAANVRPPVAFALYVLDANATTEALRNQSQAAPPTGNYSFYTGQGFLIRGNLSAPREGLINDLLEVLVDGPLSYFETAAV